MWKELKKAWFIFVFLGISFSFLILPNFHDSVSVRVFKRISNDLLPQEVEVISPNPTKAFMVIIEISFLLGFIFSLPIFIYKVVSYLFPALYLHERQLLIRNCIFIIPLFLMGCLFAYWIFIPAIFKWLYVFIFGMELVPFLELGFFFEFVVAITFVFGLVFLIPLVMRTLTKLRMVKKRTWKNYFSLVFVVGLVVGAFITPDGTGITQLIFAGTLILLYTIGWLISPKGEKD